MNRASRTVWPLFMGLVCSVVLVGCVSSASPGGKLPSSSASGPVTPSVVVPTVPADVPLAGPNLLGPDEAPPVMPVAATRHDAAGATAFAEFFIRTLDWGYATTSSAYMRHYFEPSCDRCTILAGDFDSARKNGSHYEGDRLTITRTTMDADPKLHGGEYAPSVYMAITAVRAVSSSGSISNEHAALDDHRETVYLAWQERRWAVIYMAGAN